jgi:methionine-rich copper-binding protein CopC
MRLKHGMRSVLIVFGILLSMPSASAHAVLVFSNPAAGANLKIMPSTIEVEFDGNLINLGGAKTNFLVVQDSQGKQIDLKDSKVSGPILTVGVKSDTKTGIYNASWRVVSNDGHPVKGSFQFSVGKALNVAAPNTDILLHHSGESFWVHHRSHIFLLTSILLVIGLWGAYEVFRRKRE